MLRTCVTALFVIFCLTLIQTVELTGPALSVAAEEKKSGDNSGQEASGKKSASKGTSDAERVVRIKSSLESDRLKKTDLEKQLKDFQKDFDTAAAELNKQADALDEGKEKLENLRKAGKSAEAAKLEEEIKKLEKKYSLAKKRSDLIFAARTNIQQQIKALDETIQRDQQILESMQGTKQPEKKGEAPAAAEPREAPTAAEPREAPTAAEPREAPEAMKLPVPGMPAVPVAEKEEVEKEPLLKETATVKQIEARKDTEKKTEEAERAQKIALDYAERKKALEDQIVLQEKLLITAEEANVYLEDVIRTLQQDREKKISAGAGQSELNSIEKEINKARGEIAEVDETVKKTTDSLEDLKKELIEIEKDQEELFQEAEDKRKEAETARKRSIWLESPFHPVNVLKWAINRGPRMFFVILTMAVLFLIVRMSSQRAASIIAQRGRGTGEERVKRTHTLSTTLRGALNGVIIIGGTLVLLQEAGMDIKTVLGGAAVLGLAFAFGAQNLMRDYFNGFMILLEGQFQLNDVILIGDVAGLVERMTMRITVLRDLDGRVHFIPNGQIKRVTNLTHEFSRTLFDIVVAYEGNVDRAMEIMVELANEIRTEEKYAGFITGEPVMLGVDQFTESGVLIKMIMDTKAGKMWPVRRELLRRMKNKFDEEGIEVAIPHRKIYQRPGNKDA
jgi:small conductance mechanosensitive channel